MKPDITAEITARLSTGYRILLHGLDLSKTGLLAPSLEFLQTLRAAHGKNLDIVIDACQSRLSPASIRAYLALDAIVLITGSKFFTGPPFAGAALIPKTIAARLQTGTLPAGAGRVFRPRRITRQLPRRPQTFPPPAITAWLCAGTPPLAEMRAFFAVPAAGREQILTAFAATVTRKIAEKPRPSLCSHAPLCTAPTLTNPGNASAPSSPSPCKPRTTHAATSPPSRPARSISG